MMPEELFALQLTEEEHLNRLDFIAAALRCEAPLTRGCIASSSLYCTACTASCLRAQAVGHGRAREGHH